MRKTHYIPVTADVPGAASEGNCALIRKVIRTALAAEGVDVPCEVDVLLTNDSGIHEINREMRQVDASSTFGPGSCPHRRTRTRAPAWCPWGTW